MIPALRALVPLAVALLAVAPARGLADSGELYGVLALEPGWASAREPYGSGATGGAVSGAIALGAYHPVTDRLLLGAVVRLSLARDVAYDGVAVALPDGSPSTGRLYANDTAVGAGAAALYRPRRWGAIAPVLGLELGLEHHGYTALDHVPEGAAFAVRMVPRTRLAAAARGSAALEYRLARRTFASAGVALAATTAARWHLALPVSLGLLW